MRLFCTATWLAILGFLGTPLQAQQAPLAPGSLDPSFGQGGKVVTVVGQSSGANAMAIQSNNRIVLAGSALVANKNNFALARYHDNGQLDNDFGTGGLVTTSVGPLADIGLGVAVDSKGRIVAAGFTQNAAGYDFGLAAYTSQGNLDNTFGSGGIVVTDFNGGTDLPRGGVVIMADRRPLAIGEANFSNTSWLALSRYTSNGALDSTFGTGGKVTTLIFNTVNNRLFGGTLQADGKIIGTGHAWTGTRNDTIVARYNTDGSLDPTFGSGGTIITPFIISTVALASTGNAAVVQSDGKIVVAGTTTSVNGSFFVVALSRYLANGTLDTTFGSGGIIVTPGPGFGFANQEAKAVVMQSDGKIVIAGYQDTGNNTPPHMLVARYNTDGSLDASFGQGGMAVYVIGTDGDVATSVRISNGKILAAGQSGSGVAGFAIVRIIP